MQLLRALWKGDVSDSTLTNLLGSSYTGMGGGVIGLFDGGLLVFLFLKNVPKPKIALFPISLMGSCRFIFQSAALHLL